MSRITYEQPPMAHVEVSGLLDEFVVSQASAFAREGGYGRAESLLRPLVERSDPPITALDLQARICCQQGRLGEAVRWWERVLGRDVGNAAAQAALIRINAMQRRPVWLQTVWPLLVGAGAMCVGIAITWQARQQAVANVALHSRIVEVVKAEAETTRPQIASLLAEMTASKALHSRAVGQMAELDRLSTKFDRWEATHGMVPKLLSEIQAEVNRLSVLTTAQAVGSSNQMESWRQAFAQELAAAKASFQPQRGFLRADIQAQAAQREAMLTISNQISALRLVVDRESALMAAIEQRRVAAETLQADYRTLTASHETLLARTGSAPKPPNVEIAVAGVRSSVSDGVLIVTFNEGLFDHGTHFKAGAKECLLSVAKALSPLAEPLQIQVTGYADDDRGFFKWTAQWENSLALRRAAAVVDYCINHGLLLDKDFSAVSGSSNSRPFPSDSVQSRIKNRTVVLRAWRNH